MESRKPQSRYPGAGAILRDKAVLQSMLDFLAMVLAARGLVLNARKTKWMMAAEAKQGRVKYTQAVAAEQLVPLHVNNTVIELVDEFSYLGVLMDWRWSWATAWRKAIKLAEAHFRTSSRGGFDRKGTLETMLAHAQGKIFCHLTYIMALTGAGGCKSSAPYLDGQRLVRDVLKKIAGYPFLNGEALQAEAGVWDLQTRIDMLLLRFWCKITCMPRDSVVYRAMCLSVYQWRERVAEAPRVLEAAKKKLEAARKKKEDKNKNGQQVTSDNEEDGRAGGDEKDAEESVEEEDDGEDVEEEADGDRDGDEEKKAAGADKSNAIDEFAMTDHSRINALHKQPWAQQLEAAARRQGINVDAVLRMHITAVVRVQVQVAPGVGWDDVDAHGDGGGGMMAAVADAILLAAGPGAPEHMRLVMAGGVPADERHWHFAVAARVSTVESALGSWTTVLKEACFHSLRWHCNRYRQGQVQRFLARQISEDTPLRRWAMFTSCSFQQAYWRALDVVAARRLLRLRMDAGPNEDNVRRRGLAMVTDTGHKVVVDRLDDCRHRVCYCCGNVEVVAADGHQTGVFVPETLEHLLLRCEHPDLVAARAAARAALQTVTAAVARSAGATNVTAGLLCPDFANDTALWTAHTLCGSLGPVEQMGLLQPMPMPVAPPLVRAGGPALAFEADVARRTAQWIGALTGQWVDSMRGPRYDAAVVDQLPGGLLVNEMVRHAMDLCVIHRRCLRGSRAYLTRARDPVESYTTRTRPALTDEQRKARKAAGRQKKKDKANPVGPVAELARMAQEAIKAAEVAVRTAAKAAAKAAAVEARRQQREQRRAAAAQARADQQAAADLQEQQRQHQSQEDRVRARAYRAQVRQARFAAAQVETATAMSGRVLPVSATARTSRRPTGTSHGASSTNNQEQPNSGPSREPSRDRAGNVGLVDTDAE